MANGYGGSSGSSGSSYSSSPRTTSGSSANMPLPPPGFHYMPDGTLMSDVEHANLNKVSSKDLSTKIIKSFKLDTSNIKAKGENRTFTVSGSKNSVFSLIVVNNHGNYYNFDSKTFVATPSRLESTVINSSSYSGSIKFPKLPDANTDTYDLYLMAEPQYNTKHVKFNEVRYADNTIDFNSSKGSDSAVLVKKIYQHADKDITLSAISTNNLTAFSSVAITTQTITVGGGNSIGKISFTVIATVAATRNVVIKRQVEENDFIANVTRTIGGAAIPITGEDVSSSTFYKWPIDNIVGLRNGMYMKTSNATVGTLISDYNETVEETLVSAPSPILPSTKTKRNRSIVFEKGVQSTGVATVTNGVVTSQAGNVVFNLQQADALKGDSVKIYGQGRQNIKNLSGYDVKFSNLKVELTAVTTTVDGAVSNHTNVTVDERAGIRDKVSTVTGIGIDTSSAVPTVTSGAGAVNGSGVIVLSATQTLEDGITLTFGGASRIATITGDIEVLSAGAEDLTLRVDLEKILTAT